MLKRLVMTVLILVLLIPAVPSRASAADDSTVMKTVFIDAFYGGAVGALLGVGFMLLRDKPSDHWNYIAYGAGGGIIAGAAIGLATSTRAVAEIKGNKVTFHLPEIKTDILRDEYQEEEEVIRKLYLVRYHF